MFKTIDGSFNDIKISMQVISGDTTFEEHLEKNGIKIEQRSDDIIVARSIGARVTGTSYSYLSPHTHNIIYINEYVEVHDGAEEFGCYVVASDEPIEDIIGLYDTLMLILKESKRNDV